jgi:CBS domain-containing protein
MEEWIEEEVSLLGDGDGDKALRVLDQEMIREPIRRLDPRPPLSLPPAAPPSAAIGIMREHRIGCVLVVDAGRLVGIITERDLLLKLDSPDTTRPVSALMTPDPEALTPDDPIVYALNKMSVGGFRHVPLVDAAYRPVGIISVKDIVDYLAEFFPNDVLTVPPDPARAEAWRDRDGG